MRSGNFAKFLNFGIILRINHGCSDQTFVLLHIIDINRTFFWLKRSFFRKQNPKKCEFLAMSTEKPKLQIPHHLMNSGPFFSRMCRTLTHSIGEMGNLTMKVSIGIFCLLIFVFSLLFPIFVQK